MAKELGLQTKIIHSVRRDKGYARKLSNRFTIGIPDLLIGLFPFAPIVGEVKDLGIVVDKFDRQLDVTPKQAHELKQFAAPYEFNQTIYTPSRRSSVLFVGIQHRGEHRLVVLPYDADRLNHEYEANPIQWVRRGVGGYYDIGQLLDGVGAIQVMRM